MSSQYGDQTRQNRLEIAIIKYNRHRNLQQTEVTTETKTRITAKQNGQTLRRAKHSVKMKKYFQNKKNDR